MRKIIASLIGLLILITGLIFYHKRPYVKYLKDDAVVIVRYVGDKPIYSAQYLIETRIGNKLVVELIISSGHHGVIRMEDGEAEFYLEGMGL
jgi:hypothetical protein